MDKIELVEESYRNGEEIVFYDEESDTIWVCFGGTEIKDKHTIEFKDCSKADIKDGDTEYYGDIENGSYNISYYLQDYIITDLNIPTRFFEGERMEVEQL